MLVLSRKLNESIIIDGEIRVTVVGIRGNQVRLGIAAPGTRRILREELCAVEAIEEEPERQIGSSSRTRTGQTLRQSS